MAIRVLPVAAPLVSLLFYSAPVVALGVNVAANCTLSSFTWVCALWFRRQQYILWPLYDLMALCPDLQLCRPKSMHGRRIHDGYMFWGV